MRIVALQTLGRFLSVREIRRKLVEDVALTVQVFAISMFFLTVISGGVMPQLKIAMNFVLVGICLVSAIVLLTNNLRDQAGTALWFGAIASMLASTDLERVESVLMLLFAFICMWLMWYVVPWLRETSGEPSSDGPVREF